ncbi:hypothetical protein ACOI2J_23215 [Klebsiella pneumoniae]|uniref:hypothetical protein n=1 Tax=Klebsiella pneumoniae TaxID=573 RepID=UPI003B592CE2
MQKEHFKANTQYNDYKGTVAADRADQDSFSDFLRAKGILKEGEIGKVRISRSFLPKLTR